MSDPMIPLYEPWDPCFCDGPRLDIEPGNRPATRLGQEHQRGCVVNDVARCLFPRSAMKLYDVNLTCDHAALVLAESSEQAASMVAWHAEVEGTPFEVDLDGPEVLAWYPGPFSNDAIVDRCHTED